MKIFFRVIIAALILLVGGNAAEAAKKVVAVMPMENTSGYNQHRVAEMLTEELTNVVYHSGSFTVAERTQLAHAMRELGFQNSGMVSGNKEVEFGQMTGAQYMVVGKITLASVVNNPTKQGIGAIFGYAGQKYVDAYRGKVSATVRFIDTNTGVDVFSTQIDGSSSDNNGEVALHEACHEAAQKFLRELDKINPFSAVIVDVDGDTVYIDRGSADGIRQGETLEIVREGAPIKNREGQIIAVKQTVIGTLTVQQVNPDHAICRVKSRTGTITNGAIVRRKG